MTNKAMNLAATKKMPIRWKGLNGKKQAMKIIVCAVLLALSAGSAFAAEGGSGFYLLGQRGQGAGVLPPEGVFFSLPSYYYSGDASNSEERPGGRCRDLHRDAHSHLGDPCQRVRR